MLDVPNVSLPDNSHSESDGKVPQPPRPKKWPRLTANRARELLIYEPETGRLTWRIARPGVCPGALVGTITSDGYAQLECDGRFYRAHRVIWLIMTGRWPKHFIDHRNGMRRDNRWKNLREATNAQNCHNRRPSARNSSGRVGVVSRGNRWCAFIGVANKNISLGCYSTFSKAAAVRAEAERIHYGQFAPGVADAA